LSGEVEAERTAKKENTSAIQVKPPQSRSTILLPGSTQEMIGGCLTPNTTKETTMKKLIPLLVALMTLPAVSALAADAKALYEKDCAKCHGADGKGETKMGKKMGAKDYTSAKVQEALTDEAAFKAIKDGFKDKEGKVLMKPAEGTSDDDIKALVAYMRKFKK
jgi:cytochrome c553